jgi:hemerythrin
MPRAHNFIDDFQKDHSELLGLLKSFHRAIESSNINEANGILNRIDDITSGHFSFEETYLYPRLQRLVREITGRLHNEQEATKEFIRKSRNTLSRNKVGRPEVLSLLAMLPKLSKFFEDCDKITFLAKRFDDEEKEYLHKRFKECSKKEKRLILR